MMISYGHQIDPKDDHFVSIADQALASMSKAGIFGSFMVDYFPLCKFLYTFHGRIQPPNNSLQ